MALEYCDGFDTYTVAQLTRRYPLASATNVSLVSGYESVGQAIKFIQGTPNGSLTIPLTARNEYYVGFMFQTNTLNGQTIATLLNASSGTICSFTTTSLGGVNTTFGNSSTTGIVFINTWHYIQIHVIISATVGVVQIKVDGNLMVNLSGQNTGVANIANIRLETIGESGLSDSVSIDHLWVLNTSGTHSNSWCNGITRVRTLVPVSDGTYTDWAPNSGTTHYSRVSETPADDDTTYNSAITVNSKDSYGISTIAVAPAHIHGVAITAIFRKTDVDSKTFQLFSKSGATETYSSSLTIPVTYTTSTISGVAALLHTDDPATGVEWTQTGVNNLEIGAKIIT